MTVRVRLLYAIFLQMEIDGVCRLCLACGRDWCIRIALTPVSTASVSLPKLCVLAFMRNVLESYTMQMVVLRGVLLRNLGKTSSQAKAQDIGLCGRKRGHYRSSPSA